MTATNQAKTFSLLALLACACNFENEGLPPPAARFNFPVAALLPRSADGVTPAPYLYLINSNFEARYNANSVQTLDLLAIEAAIAACEPGQDPALGGCVLSTEEPSGTPLVTNEALISSFVADAALSANENRIYLAQRGNANLAVIDVDGASGELSCGGAEGFQESCSDAYQRSTVSSLAEDATKVPNDPTALQRGLLTDFGLPAEQGEYILMSHRGGEASFFVDSPVDASVGPILVDALDELPLDLQGIGLQPGTAIAWLPSSSANAVVQVGVAIDGQLDSAEQARLFDLDELSLVGVDSGSVNAGDLRQVRFDPRPERHLAYILARRPEALILVDVEATDIGRLGIVRVIPVGFGPSRFELATLGGRLVALVSCFDSRNVYVVDVDVGTIITVIPGMSGPFAVTVDALRQRVYVVDFTVSVLRIVSLQKALDCFAGGAFDCTPEIIATVGVPIPVRQLQ